MPLSECAKCGGKLSSHAMKCPHCGAAKDQMFPKIVECSECGSEFNVLASSECPTCGAPKKIATKNKTSIFSRVGPDFWTGALTSLGFLLLVYLLWGIFGDGETTVDDLGMQTVQALSNKDFSAFKKLNADGLTEKEIEKLIRSGLEKGNLSEKELNEIIDSELEKHKGRMKKTEEEEAGGESSFQNRFNELIKQGEGIALKWGEIKYVKVTGRNGAGVRGEYDRLIVIVSCEGKQYEVYIGECRYLPAIGWRRLYGSDPLAVRKSKDRDNNERNAVDNLFDDTE